jgi:hypothetical protein
MTWLYLGGLVGTDVLLFLLYRTYDRQPVAAREREPSGAGA